MKKIIYVPQGFSATLDDATATNLNIEGLYTENFTSCNILICIGDKSVSLMHIDWNRMWAPKFIVDEVNNLIDIKKIIIFYRENIGEDINKALIDCLRNYSISSQKCIPSHDGILISVLDKIPTFFSKKISLEGLIHHPQEKQLLTVEIIGSLIGWRAMKAMKTCRMKPMDIFSGYGWQPYTEKDLKIDDAHELTQEELKILSKNDNYYEVGRKLLLIFHKASEQGLKLRDDIDVFISSISLHLERYLNDYHYEQAFKVNVEISVNYHFEKKREAAELSEVEKGFIGKFKEIVNNSNDFYGKFLILIQEYKAKKTVFLENVFSACDLFIQNYKELKFYDFLEAENKKNKENAKKHAVYGIEEYRRGNYVAAYKILTDVLHTLTYSCLRTEPELATAYYNLGRTLFKLDKFKIARSYYEVCLELYHNLPTASTEAIKKAENALKECNEKLQYQEVQKIYPNK